MPVFLIFSTVKPNIIRNVNAEDSVEDLQKQLDDLKKQLADIQKQQQDLQGLIDSEEQIQGDLSSQVIHLDNQISSYELKIQEKEVDIEAKETEIKILEQQITENNQQTEKLQTDINELEVSAESIITSIYIDSKTNSLLDILLTSSESKSFVSQIQYHLAIGESERSSLEKLQENRLELEKLTESLAETKLQVEKIAESIKEEKLDLEKYESQLSEQRNIKNGLLAESQQKVQVYQIDLSQLSDEEKQKNADINLLQQKLFESIGTIPSGEYVKAGTIIGMEGNTGCTSDPGGFHTHYFAAENNISQNPCYLLPSGIIGGCGTQDSKFPNWPYTGSFMVSQWYAGWHQALDIAYYSSSSSKYVYASHDGWLLRDTEKPPYACDPSWCNSSSLGFPVSCKGPANYVIICENKDCTQGLKTGYWHLK